MHVPVALMKAAQVLTQDQQKEGCLWPHLVLCTSVVWCWTTLTYSEPLMYYFFISCCVAFCYRAQPGHSLLLFMFSVYFMFKWFFCYLSTNASPGGLRWWQPDVLFTSSLTFSLKYRILLYILLQLNKNGTRRLCRPAHLLNNGGSDICVTVICIITGSLRACRQKAKGENTAWWDM